ncbi:MAG: Anti-sigma factor antagonist [Actinomycetia bacterium]|nr:Anti-sigma factor antagonist [Actinomycetes bacterium]
MHAGGDRYIDRTAGDVMSDAFRIEVLGETSFITMVLHGDVDFETAEEVHRVVSDAFTRGTSMLTIDLRNVKYLDSSGIHELTRAYFGARVYGTKVVIVGANGPVARALEVAGLASIMG